MWKPVESLFRTSKAGPRVTNVSQQVLTSTLTHDYLRHFLGRQLVRTMVAGGFISGNFSQKIKKLFLFRALEKKPKLGKENWQFVRGKNRIITVKNSNF